MKNREFWKGLAAGILMAVIFFAAGIWGYHQGLFSGGWVLSDSVHVKKLRELEYMIDRYYLEEKDEEALAEGLYTGLFYGLGDPYSRYYTAEEYKQANEATEGSYEGIGIVLQKNSGGGVKVVLCYEGGPGKEAGMKEDDIISAIDGEDITDMALGEVVSLIKDSEKEKVTLTVHREEEEEPLEIIVAVTDVELPSVFYEMLDDRTGYMQITEFTGVTYNQYMEAFADLTDSGMENLVVDLRGNPGGLLDSVCDILRQILPEGLIVYTEDKCGNREEETCDGANPLKIPLAVLVNENSASASEIFAGAVQDYGVGTIVGTNTYGKGIVQAIRTLTDGSAVKLTVSRYYTPKGNDIHKEGISPDIPVELDVNLLAKDEISHKEDNQLQKALEVLHGNLNSNG